MSFMAFLIISVNENKAPLINLLDVRIFSSSPKLNFFIISPVQTATAAAGVESLRMYFSNFSKAEFRVEISFGSLAKA